MEKIGKLTPTFKALMMAKGILIMFWKSLIEINLFKKANQFQHQLLNPNFNSHLQNGLLMISDMLVKSLMQSILNALK